MSIDLEQLVLIFLTYNSSLHLFALDMQTGQEY
jgi:hypothetical protein